MRRSTLLAVLLAWPIAVPLHAADAPPVPYPKDFRDWTHVKSMQIHPGHALYDAFGGIHHLYANAKALAGYRSGTFPDGAIIVFDLHEANTADNATVAGARKVLGVMHKDSKRYAQTGGWGFEAFKGDSTTERVVGANARDACFACHATQARPDYVFSTFAR